MSGGGAAQAMARIWRDGQRRPCHIYRLLTTGGAPCPPPHLHTAPVDWL